MSSLRLTRLSTSAKEVALWSELSLVASSRSVIHIVGDSHTSTKQTQT